MKSLFSIVPAVTQTAEEADTAFHRNKEAMSKALSAYCDARSARRDYELRLTEFTALLPEDRAAYGADYKRRADIAKMAMCAAIYKLSNAVANLVTEAMGSWCPAADQAGTGLDVEELKLIAAVSGHCEMEEFGEGQK